MTIGPLEYVVIEEQDHRVRDEIVPVLNALQEGGAVRVVDLVFVTREEMGMVTTQEVADLPDEGPEPYESLVGDRWGLLTAEDIDTLAAGMPANATAVIVLLEHLWAVELAEAVTRGGGVLLAGGLVPTEALAQVSAELSMTTVA